MTECCVWVTAFPNPLKQTARLGSSRPRLRDSWQFAVSLVPRLYWGTYVKRTFISAAAILAFTAAGHADELSDIQAQAKQLRDQNQALMKRLSDIEKRQKALETQAAAKPAAVNPVDAMAADLPYKAAVKAPAEVSDDLCWHGVCLYGNFDMGVAYVNHSAPYNAMAGGPLTFLPEVNSQLPSYAGVSANMMSTSFIGLRGKQEVADNLYAVFNLQTLFNPASGMNANGIGSVVQNNGLGTTGIPLGSLANSFGDSSKAGQMFNNVAYFGVSSPTYGTFTMGRQSALTSDLAVNYDALSGSNAWSLITFEGATGGGGVTEDRIYDNAYEYRLNVGPVRFAGEVQLPNGGNSGTGLAYEGDVGFDYLGFSMDFVGGHIKDAVSTANTLSTVAVNGLTANQLGAATTGAGVAVQSLGYAIPCSLGCLSSVISDNTVFAVAGKYTWGPAKFYAGYEHIQFANPSNPLQPGAFAEGGYNVGFVNNDRYFTNRNQDVFWAGVKYAVTPTFDVIGAYYGIRQHFFQAGNALSTTNPTGIQFFNLPGAGTSASQAAICANISSTSSPGCAGFLNMVSFALDWRFARHLDLYAGVAYTVKGGGLLNNSPTAAVNGVVGSTYNTFNSIAVWDPGIGLRYQF
jgi:predicted porin